MTNPFEALDISDDEETFQQTTQQKVVKRTHQEKRLYKQAQQQEAAKAAQKPAPVVNESLPERTKENAKVVRHNNRGVEGKPLGEGHYLDRRSGTGRVDRPRKEGGGWGQVGNLKDEFKKDKYIKEGEETKPQTDAPEGQAEETKPEEPKPEEPQAPTLAEYYKNKGVEVTGTYEKKAPAKKGEINADWLKKEKLTVLESKEDKKLGERNGQNVVKFTSARVGLDENLEGLGFFGSKAPVRHERTEERTGKGKGGKKALIREEDFPTL